MSSIARAPNSRGLSDREYALVRAVENRRDLGPIAAAGLECLLNRSTKNLFLQRPADEDAIRAMAEDAGVVLPSY